MTEDELEALFDKQYPTLPTGGFHNPRVVFENDDFIEFRCHYDNFGRKDDCWTWYFYKKTKEFDN